MCANDFAVLEIRLNQKSCEKFDSKNFNFEHFLHVFRAFVLCTIHLMSAKNASQHRYCWFSMRFDIFSKSMG